MKISKSKQELASIISENGGWRDGYGFSAQDGDDCAVWFYDNAPVRSSGAWWITSGSGLGHCGIEDVAKLPNWHQTILSRAEYFHLHPAPDADGCIKRDENGIISIEYNKDKQEVVAPGELDANGWIEWNGGKCPVDKDARIDIRMTGGTTHYDTDTDWGWNAGSFKITHYRLHKPEQSEPEFCESVMRSIPEPEINSKNINITQVDDIGVVESKPTIEQLAADYRKAKGYADRKQQEADDAKADADEKLGVLEIAGEALGLLVSPITEKQEPEHELVITDWRDLQVGDEIEVFNFECPESESRRKQELISGPCVVMQAEGGNVRIELKKNLPTKGAHWNATGVDACEFKFIRRP